MRDAFGGAFMIRLFLVFIFIYMFFTAIALNYAKAFKVKNKVIDYLEDNEVILREKKNDNEHINAAQRDKMDYFIETKVVKEYQYRQDKSEMKCSNEYPEVYCNNGIRIIQIDARNIKSDNLGTYYRVETFFTWNLGFLKIITQMDNNSPNGSAAKGIWRISGETRTIIKR